jgi:hypothetical protein
MSFREPVGGANRSKAAWKYTLELQAEAVDKLLRVG